MRYQAKRQIKTPEAYVEWAGIHASYNNANRVLTAAQESGYVSVFWEQVKNICVKRGVLNG